MVKGEDEVCLMIKFSFLLKSELKPTTREKELARDKVYELNDKLNYRHE